ncbi:DUF551 domain-containing protein [Escherichia coli]|nr:DUF551 domain-containing protein [Escherichia coli]EGG0969003.1 DUF551 domain-containing protein [Escherichia coli]
MTTITDKKQYPGEQYLNELITNIEFAARAPVEVVRAMAAELQKRREADSAEPVSQTYKLTFEQWLEQQHDKIDVDCGCVSTEMLMHWIRVAYEAGNYPVTPDGWISCSDRMPVIGELNWRTSFPLLVTCEIGVISAYYGFVSVNGDRHYGFMESLKYGDDSGNHPQTNEYGLISNVTHWMPLPEPPL